MEEQAMKKATCKSEVPAVLSPLGRKIEVGEVIEYRREVWYNGEGHLVLNDGKTVPDVFFDVKE
jgi:hypothetical protein